MTELLADLLERCRKGEQSAYRVVVKRFQDKALDLAQALIGDRHLAEDAIQQGFLVAFCRLDQLREPAAFPGWFRQIVRTQALRIAHKNSKKKERSVEYQDNRLSPAEKLELEELRQIVRQALSELPKSSRETAELFYLDEQNCTEVADTLNIPKGTVKRRLYDTRQKLRDMLLGYIEEPAVKRKTKRKIDKQMPL
ncbi:RNA polymerase sigma factor [Planctomycetota bacterium]